MTWSNGNGEKRSGSSPRLDGSEWSKWFVVAGFLVLLGILAYVAVWPS